MSELEIYGDHSRFDTMSTEELQEILRKHTNGEMETDPDTEDLFAIMEVLSNRRQEENPQAFRSDEEAFAEFQQYYMPIQKTKKASYLPFLPKAVAAVLILTIGISVITAAFCFGIGGELANGSFMQSTDTPVINSPKPDKTFSAEYKQLREILAAYDINEKFMPAWMPDGYRHIGVEVMETTSETSKTAITATYENGNAELHIYILQSANIGTDQIRINGSLLEAYPVGNTTYYISTHNETLQAVWLSEGFQCRIVGKITIDELKAMINSI